VVSVNARIDRMKTIIRFPPDGNNMFPAPNTKAARTLRAINEYVHTCTAEYEPGAKWWRHKKAPMTYAQYPLSKLANLIVAFGWSPKGNHTFATFQFNPSFLCQDAITALEVQFMFMFNGEYAEFFDAAKISEVEIAIDIEGVQKESCFFVDRKVRVHNPLLEAQGTLYLGGENSKNQLCIYDKQKEVKEKRGVSFPQPWTRIEATLRGSGLALNEMHTLKCPFESLLVIEAAKLKAMNGGKVIEQFKRRVFELGLHPQCAYQVSDAKEELADALNDAAPDWYQRELIWKGFPEAVYLIAPKAVQAIARSPHITTSEIASRGHSSPLVSLP
jgi:hypothetical protein